MVNQSHTSSSDGPVLLVDTQYSGNAWKVRLLASLLSISLERRTLSIVDGDLEAPEFATVNPWRQIPVLRMRDGQWLAESMAILWYLAKGTDLLPTDPECEADVLRWLAFEQTQHMVYFAQPRLRVALRQTAQVDDPEIVEFRAQGRKALEIMEDTLSERDFFVAGRPSIADVALFPYTYMADQGGYDLGPYPAVRAWLDRITTLPGYQGLLG